MDSPERLRVELAAARALGFSFDDCWPAVVSLAARSSSRPGEWLEILGHQRDVWERAFDRLPRTEAEQALASLGAGGQPDRSGDGRTCRYCGSVLPSDLDGRASFCTDRLCKRKHHYELERRRAQGLPDIIPIEHSPPRERYPAAAFRP